MKRSFKDITEPVIRELEAREVYKDLRLNLNMLEPLIEIGAVTDDYMLKSLKELNNEIKMQIAEGRAYLETEKKPDREASRNSFTVTHTTISAIFQRVIRYIVVNDKHFSNEEIDAFFEKFTIEEVDGKR